MKKRGSLFSQETFPWIALVIIIIIALIGYGFLSGKIYEAWEYFKTLWRFGR